MRFRRLAGSAFVVLTLALTIHCSDDMAINPDMGSAIRFPLSTGDSWIYELIGAQTTITPEQDTTSVVYEGNVYIINEGIEKIDGRTCYRFMTQTNINSGPDSGHETILHSWLTETDNSLVGVASSGSLYPGSAQILKPAEPLEGGERFEWGVRILDYPLTVGKSWPFAIRGDLPLTKYVTGYKAIAVKNKKTTACVVRYHVYNEFTDAGSPEADTENDIDVMIEQYYTNIGLVYMSESGIAHENGTTVLTTTTMNLIDYKLR